MICANKECKNEVNEGYKYCSSCYTKWMQQKSAGEPAPPDRTKKSGSWHDDPIVDALLKINSNLASIKLLLERKELDEGRER